MTRYIELDALVAEIEKLEKEASERLIRPVERSMRRVTKDKTYVSLCGKIRDIINTLDVKEVDLRKELNNFIEKQKAWIKDDRIVEYNNGDSFNHIYDLEKIAKHFFELGLKVQKGE